MRSLAFPGLALIALSVAVPAAATPESGVGAPPVAMPSSPRLPIPPMVQPLPPRGPMVRPASQGGSLSGYRTPSYGYQLPRTWMAPTYFISDPRAYGLRRPAPGFGWSRYYDVAVLTDQWGRVYDWRGDMAWDGAYDRGGYPEDGYDQRGRGNSGVGGAVVGGVVGGIAGNVIAGRGNRLAGTLIGGGLGALAGQAIDKGSRRHRRHHDDDYGRGFDDGGHREWRQESWSSGPHWGGGAAWSGGSYGYDGGTTVTTVVIPAAQPVMTTRTVTEYEYVSVPVKRKVVRHYRPRPKPQCVCGS